MNLIDTHAHLVCDDLYPQVDELLARAKEAGVSRILCICLSVKEVHRAYDLKNTYPWVDIAFGYHPSDLNEITVADWKELEIQLKDERIIAVGEIGLDYHWDDVEKQVQKDAFIRQINLANHFQKPVLIHMRDATQDTMEILETHLQVKGIMHCYSGSLETAKCAIKLGMQISIGGPLTFKNARGLPETIAQIPIENIHIETDCPYLTPHPHRGKQNEPSYVSYTFKKLCEIKERTEVEVSKQLEMNYKGLFGM